MGENKVFFKKIREIHLENDDKSSDEAVKLQWNDVSLVKTWAVRDRKPLGSSWYGKQPADDNFKGGNKKSLFF